MKIGKRHPTPNCTEKAEDLEHPKQLWKRKVGGLRLVNFYTMVIKTTVCFLTIGAGTSNIHMLKARCTKTLHTVWKKIVTQCAYT